MTKPKPKLTAEEIKAIKEKGTKKLGQIVKK